MRLWCLMVSRSLPWYISDHLYEVARQMAKEGLRTFDIKNELCEGRVTTEYEPMSLVCASGFGFHATVEWEIHKSQVTFIICSKDLPPLEKTRRSSFPLPFSEEARDIN